MTDDEIAHAQVAAFLKVLEERHGLDEATLGRILAVTKKNGKAYVTWAWIISILLGAVAFLSVKQLSHIESAINDTKNVAVVETSKLRESLADVRERLHTLEELYRLHASNDRRGK